MTERRRVLFLISIMAAVTFLVTAITISILYHTALERQKELLLVTVQSQARLMEEIARHEEMKDKEHPENWKVATLNQITKAYKSYKTFGETGEFVVVRRDGNQIHFVLCHAGEALDKLDPIPFDSKLAEPARLALSGKSGAIIGLDYRGSKVLAAYEPVSLLNLGVVAKIDLAEIRMPFIKAGAISFTIAALLVVTGTVLFLKGINPLIRRLQDHTRQLEAEHEKIRHLNEVLLAIRKVNQLIVKEKDLDRLIQDSCRILTSTRGYKSAWIAIQDKAGASWKMAEHGLGEAFSPIAAGLKQGQLPQCARKALSIQGVQVFEDIPSICTDCPLASRYAEQGAFAIRLECEGRVYGVLVVSLLHSFVSDMDEEDLFRELADDIAFALHSIEAEESRRESEYTLRTIFQHLNDGILMSDAETRRLVNANEAMCQILGYSLEEIKGLSVSDIHPPERLPDVVTEFEKQLRGEKMLALDIPVKRRDGSVFHADVSSVLVELRGRQYLLGVFRDITERKLAEDSIRESEKRFKILFDSAPDAYYLHDFKGIIIDGNKAAAELIGHNREELIGKSFAELKLLAPDDLKKAVAQLKKNIHGQLAGPDEYIFNRKDGKQVFAEIRSVPININGENIVLGIARDISERKILEEQLHQSQKMEAIGTLAGGVAHDFNNLLTIIIGNAKLVLTDLEDDSPLAEDIREILKAADRATSLTRQLLAFSRRQIIHPDVLDLNEVLADSEKMLKRLLSEDIEFLTLLQPGLWKVHADFGQMSQVIMNLVVNARDAMPKGGKLTLETANIELDEKYFLKHGVRDIPVTGPYVMLAVTDDGMGMDEETRSRIFEPFFTTKEKGMGTGLGLSTVYGIMKQNKGYIWTYSEPGKGTTVKIYLPRAEAGLEVMQEKGKPALNISSGGVVLVVEDEDQLRELAIKALQRTGYEILEARNGEEALEIANGYEGDIRLLLTDVVMPKMSGLELVKRIGSLYPEIKVIYMSGYTDNAIVHHGVLVKDVNFLEKPFTLERLTGKVKEVLEGE
ncbi:MAG: PAS domain S-box protein [Syntrophales bacterium]